MTFWGEVGGVAEGGGAEEGSAELVAHAAATRSTAKGVYMIGRWWSNGLKDPPVLC
ncbi:hypothetical protein ABZ345_01430 [Lentzea sp. NPDC005914]|uniref:hypothetical protein n=1 Tax=Lentzea sp. NPDC005914 TaxID=3154572 RepID=UPI0033D564C6